MSPSEAFCLGIIQGISEFLPISSSGHLILAGHLWGRQEALPMALNVALHFGTLIAVLLYFARDWWRLVTRDHRQLALLAAASLPVGLVGLSARGFIASTFHHPLWVALMLALVGYGLWTAEKRSRGDETVSWSLGLKVGLWQVLALIPGTSRSGITMAAGLWGGLSKEAAARFSFLLGTPAMVGAAALHLPEWQAYAGDPSFYIGLVTSLVTGIATIGVLMRFLSRIPFRAIFFYRLAVAVAVVATQFLR